MSSSALKHRLVDQAKDQGFAACRLCRPWDVPQMPEQLASFLARGYHGQMSWLEERAHWRAAPQVLWPGAQTVIMLAESYTPQHDPRAILTQSEAGAISVYAQNRDYHDTVKKRLKRLARWLIAEGGGEVKVFVDTAPVPEKPLGQAAGLGWQGKHTNLVSRDLGNWFFIGSVFTTLDLPVDAAEVGGREDERAHGPGGAECEVAEGNRAVKEEGAGDERRSSPIGAVWQDAVRARCIVWSPSRVRSQRQTGNMLASHQASSPLCDVDGWQRWEYPVGATSTISAGWARLHRSQGSSC